MNIPRFEFHLPLPETATRLQLLDGSLVIKKDDYSVGSKIRVTSGSQGNQYKGSWRLKGKGPLPPSSVITPQRWFVSTQRLWLPHVKGVEGSFYAISPFSINMLGVMRGDFGIHFDANVPGSAGCIVIRQQDHWDLFRQLMSEWRADNIKQVPLFVDYAPT